MRRRSAGSRLDLDDIQGLVVRGYGTLPYARFLLVGVDDPVGAGDWLQRVAATVMTAEARPADTAVNVALSASGVAALLPATTGGLDGFSPQFIGGMTDPHRSRLLGDVGLADPRDWRWGGPSTPTVDLLVLLYADEQDRLDELTARTLPDDTPGLHVLTRLETTRTNGREPFGFRDGISQPRIAGVHGARTSRAGGDVVHAGEFLLGYPNAYGALTERPLLDTDADPDGILPRAGKDPDTFAGKRERHGRPDLGRNGTYLVLRSLRQDVDGFARFLDEATRTDDGLPDPVRRDRLAAKVVGRWPDGAPLVLAPEQDDPALGNANAFGYHEQDAWGRRCPIGAHVRRSNPRDSLEPNPGSGDSWEVNNRHRLLRRGRVYEEHANGRPEAGLHFMCLSANLSRQYEFVQHTWVNNP